MEGTTRRMSLLLFFTHHGLLDRKWGRLHLAVEANNVGIVRSLLKLKADPNLQRLDTLATPLHLYVTFWTLLDAPSLFHCIRIQLHCLPSPLTLKYQLSLWIHAGQWHDATR